MVATDRPVPERRVRIGYAPGAYDLFHIGHLNILRAARERCDYLIAGVVSDDKCEATKGVRPWVPHEERLAIVGAVRWVDQVYAETEDDKRDAWRDLGFTHLFKGDDWRGTAKGERLERDFAPLGVEIVYLPYTLQTSSTQLRRVLRGPGRHSGAVGG